jgi:hypothetical protein
MNTKTIQVSNLTGPALDWAVAKIEGTNHTLAPTAENPNKFFTFAANYCGEWAMGGPIIERECMEFDYDEETQMYSCYNGINGERGKTHLIAAMRCFCASKLGDTADIPEELSL